MLVYYSLIALISIVFILASFVLYSRNESFLFSFTFYTLLSQCEFFPWESQVTFCKESQLQHSHEWYPTLINYKVHAGWVFSCFCSPPNSDMDHVILNVRTGSFLCMCIQTGVGHTDYESAQLHSWKTHNFFLVLLSGFEILVFRCLLKGIRWDDFLVSVHCADNSGCFHRESRQW